MKKLLFKGSCVAIVTPFLNGEVDYEGFKRVIDFQIENGTRAVIACGTTGESATLSTDEKKAVIAAAVKHVNGRVPVIAGTGFSNTASTLELSKYAEEAGADGIMVVTPFYNKPTQDGLVAHFTHIADRVNLPMMVYNVPSRTGVNILPETYARLAPHKNINSAKEANGSVSALTQTLAHTKGALNVYCGNDDEVVPFLAMGAVGVVSVLANCVPKQVQDVCELYFNGEGVKSAELMISLNELHHALFCETSPAPVKYAMSLLGLCSDEVRLPLVEMRDKPRVERALRNLGVI